MACVHPCLSRHLTDLRQALLESHPARLGEIQNRRGFALAELQTQLIPWSDTRIGT